VLREVETRAVPGYISLPLIVNTYGLIVSFPIGTSSANNSTAFTLISNTRNVIFSNYTNVSASFVPTAPFVGSQPVYDFLLDETLVSGNIGYEWLIFGSDILTGQGILNATNNTIGNRLGFGFNKTGDLGLPNFVENLFNQGYLNNKILSINLFFPPMSGTDGQLDLGGINFSAIDGPLVNYSVTVNNGDWAFLFQNMHFGNIPLGYNGLITVNTNSPFNVVPMPVFQTLISLCNIPPSTIFSMGQLTSAQFNCSILTSLPNVTYYLNGQPLILTPNQYVGTISNGSCLFGFAGSNTVDPDQATFTLGNIFMNSTYTVFDFEQRTMGRGALSLA